MRSEIEEEEDSFAARSVITALPGSLLVLSGLVVSSLISTPNNMAAPQVPSNLEY